MTEEDPRVVRPADLLSGVRSNAELNRFSAKILSKTDPPGTPYAKMRLGLVVAFDATTWTVTALIGDQLTQVSGIPVLAGVVPVIECAGQFVQVGGDSTTEYTLIGMLGKAPGVIRIRKPSGQSVTNSASIQTDTALAFQGLAGRTYLFEVLLILSNAFINNDTVDLNCGWLLPTGATWSGGGPGPDPAATHSVGRVATPTWKGFVSAVGWTTYGSIATNSGDPVIYPFKGSIKMGATSGLCSVRWGQFFAVTGTTTINEGSYLKVDMTSEYTL